MNLAPQNLHSLLLRAQVAYAEEQVECRRVMLLSWFGEKGFSAPAHCRGTCDICRDNAGQAFQGGKPAVASCAW